MSDELLAELRRSNDEIHKFINDQGAINEQVFALQANANVERVTNIRAVTPPGLDGVYDFLFGSKVRQTSEARSISGSVDPYGGYLLTSDQNSFYAPLLLSPSAAMAAGIPFIPTGAAEIRMPMESTDPTAAWTGEGDTISESTPIWHLGTVPPRKLAALVGVPNEMMQQGETSPYIARIIERRMARALSGELDRAVFEGNGVGQPLGLRETSGINEVSMGDNGATFTNLDPFADAIGELTIDNCEARAIVMHPRDWKNLLKLKEATSGNNKPLLQESAGSGSQGVRREIYGVPVFLTSRLSTTEVQGSSGAICTSAYVFDTMWLAFAQRQAMEIATDRSRLFNQDKTEIRATLRGNLVTMQPTAICRIKGIKAS